MLPAGFHIRRVFGKLQLVTIQLYAIVFIKVKWLVQYRFVILLCLGYPFYKYFIQLIEKICTIIHNLIIDHELVFLQLIIISLQQKFLIIIQPFDNLIEYLFGEAVINFSRSIVTLLHNSHNRLLDDSILALGLCIGVDITEG
ncbi:hypothetical protein D3C80_1360160 [compost metagenome]